MAQCPPSDQESSRGRNRGDPIRWFIRCTKGEKILFPDERGSEKKETFSFTKCHEREEKKCITSLLKKSLIPDEGKKKKLPCLKGGVGGEKAHKRTGGGGKLFFAGRRK